MSGSRTRFELIFVSDMKEGVDVNIFSDSYPVDLTPFVEELSFLHELHLCPQSSDLICLFLDSLLCAIALKVLVFTSARLP